MESKMPISVKSWYIFFLRVSEAVLLNAVDLYNAGSLHPNARIALEIMEGLPITD